MQKPITIIRQEFVEKIVEVVNTSGLPFFVIEPILKDLLESVQQGAKARLEKDWAEYEEYVKKEAVKDMARDSMDAGPSETEG